MEFIKSYASIKQYAIESYGTTISKANEFEQILNEKEGLVFLGSFVGLGIDSFSTSSHRERERFVNNYKCTIEVLDFLINANILKNEEPLSLISTHVFGKTKNAVVTDIFITQYDFMESEYDMA